MPLPYTIYYILINLKSKNMKIPILISSLVFFLVLFLYASNYYEYRSNIGNISGYGCASKIPLKSPIKYREFSNRLVPQGKYDKASKSFSLEEQYLLNLPTDFFQNGDCIEQLSLKKNSLSFIPKAIFKIKNLDVLDISENRFKEVSSAGLSKLKYFNLEKNQIRRLDIDGFTNLHVLKVNDNLIEIIDKITWTFIKKIDFSNCKFARFPNHLLKVKGLEELNLGNNRMNDFFPGKFNYYSSTCKVKKIDLSGNYLTTFPDPLGRLLELETLELDNNEIKGRVTIANFKALKTINLKHQYITSFFLKEKSALLVETIYLQDNELTNFEIMGNRPHLKRINLSRNKIPKSISEITTLVRLNLSNNDIKNVENLGQLNDLTMLNLENNPNLKYISIESLKALPSLKRLRLANLPLIEKNKKELVEYCEAREIDISFVPFTILLEK